MMNNWFKKEKPLPSLMSFGGGAGGNAVAGGPAPTGWNGVGASGGTTYDYTSPVGQYRIHKFTSTSATPFSAPGSFNRKVKYIIIGGGGGGSSPDHGGGGGSGGGGAGAVHDLTDGDHLTGSGIDLSGAFNFNVTCGTAGNGGFVPGPTPQGGGAPGAIINGGTWQGSDGGDTTVAFPTGTITADGGGCGGMATPNPDTKAGRAGGSGSGAGLYTVNLGGEATGASFPGTPGDSPPAGWGNDGGRGGADPNPNPPMNPFYMAGGGGGAGGAGQPGGSGVITYPNPQPAGTAQPTVNWKTAGRGGLGYQIPVIFRDPTNEFFEGPTGPDHWLAGGGGGGMYYQPPDSPLPAQYGYAGGGGLLAAVPQNPDHPFPGGQGWAGAGSGGVGATPFQGGSPQVSGTSANANSGSGGGGAAGGKSPTKSSGDGGTGIVLLAYCIDT